jgi:hypothetical protein
MNIDIKRNAVVYAVVLSGLLVAADPVLPSGLVISSTASSTSTQRVYPVGYAAGGFNCQAEYINRHSSPSAGYCSWGYASRSFELYSNWIQDYISASLNSRSSITIVPASSSLAAIPGN